MASYVIHILTCIQPFLTSEVNATIDHFLKKTTTLRMDGTSYLGGRVQLKMGSTDLIHRLLSRQQYPNR